MAVQNKYQYKPSHFYKKGSIYSKLVIEYNDIYKQIAKSGIESLSVKEKEIFFYGLDKIINYIYGSFFYSLKKDYESKKNIDKVIAAIYMRYVAFMGGEHLAKEEISNSIRELAERSIYYTIGVETYKKRNFKWDCENGYYENFLKHTINVSFAHLIYEKMSEINHFLDTGKDYSMDIDMHSDSDNNKEDPYELIKQSGIQEYIPKIVYGKLVEYLKGNLDIKELNSEDVKYLSKIYEGINSGG